MNIIVPADFPLDLLPDATKILNKRKFVRRGGTRRQDHATRGYMTYRDRIWDPWFGYDEDALEARKRKDYLRGGGTDSRVKTRKQRENLANEFEEALLEAGLYFLA